MNYGKYVIVEVSGIEMAILFDPCISHDEIGLRPIVAAGFFEIYGKEADVDGVAGVEVGCFGESVTMGLKSRPQQDAEIIKRMVNKDPDR